MAPNNDPKDKTPYSRLGSRYSDTGDLLGSIVRDLYNLGGDASIANFVRLMQGDVTGLSGYQQGQTVSPTPAAGGVLSKPAKQTVSPTPAYIPVEYPAPETPTSIPLTPTSQITGPWMPTANNYPAYMNYMQQNVWGGNQGYTTNYGLLGDEGDPGNQNQNQNQGSLGLPVAGGDWIPDFDFTNYQYPQGWDASMVWDILQSPYYYAWDRYGNLHLQNPVAGGLPTGAQRLGDDMMAQANWYQSQGRDDGGWSSTYSPNYYSNLPTNYNYVPGTGRGRHRQSDWRTTGHEHGLGMQRRRAMRAQQAYRARKYGGRFPRGYTGPTTPIGEPVPEEPQDGGAGGGAGGGGDTGNMEGLTEWRP